MNDWRVMCDEHYLLPPPVDVSFMIDHELIMVYFDAINVPSHQSHRIHAMPIVPLQVEMDFSSNFWRDEQL